MTHVVQNLTDGESFALGELLTASWKDITTVTLAAGDEYRIDGEEDEYAIYVIDGDGSFRITNLGSTDPLPKGGSVFAKRGTQATLTAGINGARLFVLRATA